MQFYEVSKEDIEKINPERDLHFNNLFGNKLRVIVPLEQNETLNQLIRKLEELEYEVDYEDLINKKTVYKKVKTQQGEKVRPEKVGKVLQYYKLNDLLDWWQKNSENLKNNEIGASIVVSRSPIDVLRMSDHDGISSCHSPDGSFYKCARQEARTGGAIAYVVKNSDLKKVDLQDKEIFEDTDRKIKGIVPLERLRLRRLTNGKVDLLLPELRTYGVRNIGFLDAVKNWAKNSQENLIKTINPQEDYKNFELKGGSYQDTSADRVWSSFFNTNVTGRKSTQDEEEEEEEETGNIYERAQETLEQHRREWNHVDVYLDEEGGHLDYSANAEIVINKKLFTVDIIELLDSKNWKEKREIKRIIEDALDISGIEDLEIDEYKKGNEDFYSFRFMFRDNDGHYDELTNFEHFLDYVDEVDKDFQEHINKVYKALLDQGYIKNLSERITFKNFNVELDDEFDLISKEPEKIGYLKDFEVPKTSIKGSGGLGHIQSKISLRTWPNMAKYESIFVDYINKYKIFPFKVNENNIRLFLFPNSQIVYDPIVNNEKLTDWASITGWMYFELHLNLSLNLYQNTEFIKRIKNLDNNWDFYIKKLAVAFDEFIRTTINNTKITKKASTYDDKTSKLNLNKLAQKPTFKKPQKQLTLNFKDWFDNFENGE
jgi:hypothetical protein